MESKPQFKLNLPRTDFPMRADLVTREPQRLAKWETEKLYERIQEARKNAPRFVLHDGPPFANGDVHVGTALNKILKDIIVKYKTLRGFNAPYVPGWDCHGLPIEFKVSQEMRKAGDTSADPVTIRKACDAYARKYIDLQRTQFKRLGVLGDWENPYLTLNKEYEADELRLFADLVEKGFVYRAKKPVHWCIVCRTALAEAEVEYQDYVSQSCFVKFALKGQPSTSVVIWTTTPWTLPANLAVAFNPKFTYVQAKVGVENFIVFEGLLAEVATKCGWANPEIVRKLGADDLAKLEYEHPFCARTGKLFPADFVENATGTGFVHIAPGHGLEDFHLGKSVGLPIYSPVNDYGSFGPTDDLRPEEQMPDALIGKSILEKHGKSEANEAVLHELRLKHALLHQENYHHSYPHCWRSKTPIIFRAMDQWFVKIGEGAGKTARTDTKEIVTVSGEQLAELNGLRKDALLEIEKIQWVPFWGKTRIQAAVVSRPDWCISRQRTWGVPIPAFRIAEKWVLHPEIIRRVADNVEQNGTNFWFAHEADYIYGALKLREIVPLGAQDLVSLRKSNDTLDVWIDSGSSSRAVLMRRSELQPSTLNPEPSTHDWQADLYLEGSDQHRGWFQSSLLLSLAGNGVAPFKTVLTHGFMVDEDRAKISKSKQSQGGYEKPQTADRYVKEFGADVLRLWVASQDYRNDIVVSEERLKKVSETYRGIRNTLRYQLSNLFDFDPTKHAVTDDKLTGLDRWILSEFSKLEADVLKAYDAYEFHVVYQKLSQFVAVELSSIYHDVVKDRLYTLGHNDPKRRSTQTALYRMVTGLCQMLAPVLSFTTDEAWEFIPGKAATSVQLADWKPNASSLAPDQEGLWKNLFALRNGALATLEDARKAKTIGKALDAHLKFIGPRSELQTAAENTSALQELLNVSGLTVEFSDGKTTFISLKAAGQKCERCWHWETDVGPDPKFPTICARCVKAEQENVALPTQRDG